MTILFSKNGHLLTKPVFPSKVMMVQTQTIVHFNALNNDSKVLHSMAIAILSGGGEVVKDATAGSGCILGRPGIGINWNTPFQTSLHKNSKEIFFRLTKFFLQEQKICLQGTTFVQFFDCARSDEAVLQVAKLLLLLLFWTIMKIDFK